MHEHNGRRHMNKKERNLSNRKNSIQKDTDGRKLGKLRKMETIQDF